MPFSLPNYDTWKLATPDQDEKVAFICDHCDEPIYVGESYIKTDDGRICDGCYEEFAWKTLNASEEVAEIEVYYGEND
jgi:hypothetical protein